MRLRTGAGSRAHFEIAEQDFREAIELAQKMSAKSLELRATMSFAGLLDLQGDRDEGARSSRRSTTGSPRLRHRRLERRQGAARPIESLSARGDMTGI